MLKRSLEQSKIPTRKSLEELKEFAASLFGTNVSGLSDEQIDFARRLDKTVVYLAMYSAGPLTFNKFFKNKGVK